jgi:lanosterol synthase
MDMMETNAEANIAALAPWEQHLVGLQQENGRWEGEWVWNTYVTSEWVFVQFIVGEFVDPRTRDGIIRYYKRTQRRDGSWGWHPESGGFIITTALAYVALRLLGVDAEAPIAESARQWLWSQPQGVKSIPTYGALWLAFLDLYDWKGINPFPPELLLIPKWMPIHPSRFECFIRSAFTSAMYVSGVRFRKLDGGPIIAELRKELYGDEWDRIDWSACRHLVAKTDLHVRPGLGVRKAEDLLSVYERVHHKGLRQRALDRCFESILYEERTSRNHTNSPMVGFFNCVAIYARDPTHPELRPSLAGKEAWKWEDADGIRFLAATSGVWDTAFAMQALLESPRAALFKQSLRRAYRYLVSAQVTEELPGDRIREARESSIGSWNFGGMSTLGGYLGWPVNDCTAEAVLALLKLHEVLPPPPAERISDDRLALAAEFLLGRQNDSGNYGHYEHCRNKWLLQRVNPTEVFGTGIMSDAPCAECTGSCILALVALRDALPSFPRHRFDDAIRRAIEAQRGVQLEDGSFVGAWGINYTYAIYFVLRALRAAGVPPTDSTLTRAADWLISKQQCDGGWGEAFASCSEGRYIERESQAAMTSWAVLALLEALGPKASSVVRGIAWLRARSREDGSFPAEALNGVFFASCGVDYTMYRAYFPLWALSRYEALLRGGDK